MTCRECHNVETLVGPLSASGECLECELSAETARDLETLALLAEHGYIGASVDPPSRPVGGCPECGGTESIEENGLKMCAECGYIQ